MNIIHQAQDNSFTARAEDGTPMGEISYVPDRDGNLLATHTWTEPPYRGQGVATALLDALAAYADREGKRVVPVCPFVEAAFRAYPDRYRAVAPRTVAARH